MRHGARPRPQPNARPSLPSPRGAGRGAGGEGSGSRRWTLALAAIALLVAAAALLPLGRAEAQVSAMLPDRLKNLDYPSDYTVSRRAPLRDGKYDQRAALNDPLRPALVTYISSVANNEFGAAFLATNTGGSGVFVTMHLVRALHGAATAGPGLLLGDRVRIEKAAVTDQESVVVELITQGPGEPFCCGTKRETREYEIVDNAFRLVFVDGQRVGAVPAVPRTGNAGLADLRDPHPNPSPRDGARGSDPLLLPSPRSAGRGAGGEGSALLLALAALAALALPLAARRATRPAR